MRIQVTRPARWVTGILVPLVFATAAWAVDGVVEINQASVQAAGGFPYTISSPGSYRLTSNLDVTGETNPENVTAIVISAPLVTLDLNGFMIFGSTSCSGDPLSCSPTGSGIGIDASGSFFATIRNGTVAGMGQRGIDAGNFALISDVRALANGVEGIVATASKIDRSQVIVNGGSGIVSADTSVTNSISNSNGQDGISVSNDGVVLTGNLCRGNGSDGIDVGGRDALIEGNVLTQNAGYGLDFAFSDNAYKDNVIQGNSTGTVQGGGVQTGTNLCDGNTTCP